MYIHTHTYKLLDIRDDAHIAASMRHTDGADGPPSVLRSPVDVAWAMLESRNEARTTPLRSGRLSSPTICTRS